MIKLRTQKEKDILFQGMINAYDLIIKVWPVDLEHIVAFRKVAIVMQEMKQGKTIEEVEV